VTSLAISGVVLWHLGDPVRARERCAEAIAMARASGHAYSLADALSSAAVVHSLRRESAVVRELAGDLLALSQEKGFHLTTHGKVQLGWAEVEAGEEEGLERVREGIAACRAAGARLSEMNFLSKLVEAYVRRGRLDEARVTLAEALALVESIGGRFFWKPELHRLNGELALAAESPEEARESFESALAAARSTGDKGLELRAAVSLGRLLHGSGRATETKSLLAPLFAGLDTSREDVDFLEARSLLDSCR
jgi:predicted ATPase